MVFLLVKQYVIEIIAQKFNNNKILLAMVPDNVQHISNTLKQLLMLPTIPSGNPRFPQRKKYLGKMAAAQFLEAETSSTKELWWT